MDKSWITKPRDSQQYLEGLDRFLDFALANESIQGRIICPCPSCKFKKWQIRQVVRDRYC